MYQQEFELTREKMEMGIDYGDQKNAIHFYYMNDFQLKRLHHFIEQIRELDKLGVTHSLLDGMVAELPAIPKEQK